MSQLVPSSSPSYWNEGIEDDYYTMYWDQDFPVCYFGFSLEFENQCEKCLEPSLLFSKGPSQIIFLDKYVEISQLSTSVMKRCSFQYSTTSYLCYQTCSRYFCKSAVECVMPAKARLYRPFLKRSSFLAEFYSLRSYVYLHKKTSYFVRIVLRAQV